MNDISTDSLDHEDSFDGENDDLDKSLASKDRKKSAVHHYFNFNRETGQRL